MQGLVGEYIRRHCSEARGVVAAAAVEEGGGSGAGLATLRHALVCTGLTQPLYYYMARSRMDVRVGYVDLFKRMCQEGGVRGWYRGVGLNGVNTTLRLGVLAVCGRRGEDEGVLSYAVRVGVGLTVTTAALERVTMARYAHPGMRVSAVVGRILRNGGRDLYRGGGLEAFKNVGDVVLMEGVKGIEEAVVPEGVESEEVRAAARAVVAGAVRSVMWAPVDMMRARIGREIEPRRGGLFAQLKFAARGVSFKQCFGRGVPVAVGANSFWIWFMERVRRD